jgi:transcriptional regulator with XRE-family HTH domain
VTPDPRPLPAIGANLTRLWKRAGFLNKSQFAKACGMTPQVYGALEKGRYDWPELPKLIACAKVLQCSVDAIIAGKDQDYDARSAFRRMGDEDEHKKSLGIRAEVRSEPLSVTDTSAQNAPLAQPLEVPHAGGPVHLPPLTPAVKEALWHVFAALTGQLAGELRGSTPAGSRPALPKARRRKPERRKSGHGHR